jgi:hypothetical protein
VRFGARLPERSRPWLATVGIRALIGRVDVPARDRVDALNGELRIKSPPGEGTVVAATLPIPAPRDA